MDSTGASKAPPAPPPVPRLVRGAIAAAFLLFGVLAATHLGVYAGASDSSGYMNHARLLRQGHLHQPQRAIETLPPDAMPSYAYISLGIRPAADGEMVPTYPVGLPLLIAGMSFLTGWDAAAGVVVWLHLMAGVAVTYAFARRLFFGPAAAFLAAALLATSPLYLFVGLFVLSDVPSVFWVTAAVYAAWRSRESMRWAAVAGGAVALGVLIRPTNLLVMAPIALCLGFDWRRWSLLVAGGLPGAVFLGLVNLHLYGNALTTGYGDVSEAFAAANVASSLTNYASWLPVVLTPLVVLVLGLPFVLRSQVRLVGLLATWIAVFFVFYAYYFCTHETWWSLRFVLPAFPACLLAVLLVGRRIEPVFTRWLDRRGQAAPTTATVNGTPAGGRMRAALLGALIIGVLGWNLWWSYEKAAWVTAKGERSFLEAAQWTQRNLPPRAVVVCMQTSGALLYYTDFIFLRYDVPGIRESLARIEAVCAAQQRPLYAMLYEYELTRALEQALPGTWTQVGETRNVTYWRRDSSVPQPINTEPWRELATSEAPPLPTVLSVGVGWYRPEGKPGHRWSWCRGTGHVRIQTEKREPATATLRLAIRSRDPMTVTIAHAGRTVWQGAVGTDRQAIEFTFPMRDGLAELDFTTDRPPAGTRPGPDPRVLAFAIYDPHVALSYTDR